MSMLIRFGADEKHRAGISCDVCGARSVYRASITEASVAATEHGWQAGLLCRDGVKRDLCKLHARIEAIRVRNAAAAGG